MLKFEEISEMSHLNILDPLPLFLWSDNTLHFAKKQQTW